MISCQYLTHLGDFLDENAIPLPNLYNLNCLQNSYSRTLDVLMIFLKIDIYSVNLLFLV
ncbi:peptidase T [Lactococcus lactis subsp. lactis IO-1]|nr:peptidase T [Lactococcus lactis subsp. lactis IO-1]